MNYFTLYYYLNLSLIPVLSKGTPNKQNEKIEEGLKISSPFHSIDFCFDEPNFRYHDEELLDCAWISEKKDERCNFHYLGRSVSHFCRMTCDTCANKYICDDKNNNHSNREGCFCDWVAQSKKQFCELHTENVIVADKCPCTCGNCHPVQSPLTSSSSSKVPTSVPTFQISTNEVPTIVTACIDNPNFSIFDDRDLGCDFVKEDPVKRCKYNVHGRTIESFCALTCNADRCTNKLDDSYTTVTSRQYEMEIDNELCVDLSTFVLDFGFDCQWVKEDKQRRCNIAMDGKVAREMCPATCGICEPEAFEAYTSGLQRNARINDYLFLITTMSVGIIGAVLSLIYALKRWEKKKILDRSETLQNSVSVIRNRGHGCGGSELWEFRSRISSGDLSQDSVIERNVCRVDAMDLYSDTGNFSLNTIQQSDSSFNSKCAADCCPNAH